MSRSIKVIEWVIFVWRQFSNSSAVSWREQVNFQWDDDEVCFVLDQQLSWNFIVLKSNVRTWAYSGYMCWQLWYIIDRGFEPRLGHTKDYKISICCFSAKHTALRRKSKDWLVHDNNWYCPFSINCQKSTTLQRVPYMHMHRKIKTSKICWQLLLDQYKIPIRLGCWSIKIWNDFWMANLRI
jgi:hypothetical protein